MTNDNDASAKDIILHDLCIHARDQVDDIINRTVDLLDDPDEDGFELMTYATFFPASAQVATSSSVDEARVRAEAFKEVFAHVMENAIKFVERELSEEPEEKGSAA